MATMKKLLRIEDNTKESKSKILNKNKSDKLSFDKDIPKLTEKILNKNLEKLKKGGLFIFPEDLNDVKDIDKEKQTILCIEDNEYKTGNVMGFIGYGDEKLIIESRFSNSDSNGDNDYFSHYLLEKVFDLPNIAMDTDINYDENEEFNYYLIFMFPYYLKSAMREGIFKQYIRREYNDSAVRGPIDVARHIKNNIPFTGNIAYSRREFSYDNNVTELVRHTIEFIKDRPNGNKVLSKVRDEITRVTNVTPGYRPSERRKILIENKRHTINHSYYRKYRDLQQICIMILDRQDYDIGSGDRQIEGIIFDMAWLWEEYMNTLVCEKFYHPMNKENKNKQKLFYDKKENKNKETIYPDFIGKDPGNRIIADAKYKPYYYINNKYEKDYFQLLTYMFRFDAKTGYYFYPESDGNDDRIFYLNQGTTFDDNVKPRPDIVVTKHGLKIPKGCGNYKEFKEKIKEEEEKFISAIE